MSQHAQMFYGWHVVYALCLVITFTSGLIFYNLSVLLDAFVAERAFPVGLSSIATGVFFIAAGIAGLVAGHLIDRVDARIVMIVSACIGVLALGCIGLLREPWQLFAFYIVFGCSYGGVGLRSTARGPHQPIDGWLHGCLCRSRHRLVRGLCDPRYE